MSEAIATHAQRWLALLDGSPVGFVSAGPPRDPDPPANGELYAVHVDSAHHRLGIGRVLLDRAIVHLRTLDSAAAYLWVLEANTNARAAYEHHGWKEDGGTRSFKSGTKTVGETRYRFAFE